MKKKITQIQSYLKTHPTAAVLAVLCFLILIFISPAFFRGRYLAPVDTLHFVAPYLDITTQMLPWWKLSGEIIRSGHFPFWNIYSGLGLPLFANMQSAILFPLTWLFYIFTARLALLAYAFSKLFLMGLFTYFYLRELKLSFYPRLLGAILFAFAGVNVIWFLWPLTSVILILPLSFFLIEKYFNTGELKFALWLVPVTTLGLLAGHPQTFFYVFCLIYAYTIFKIATSNKTFKKGTADFIALSSIYFLGALLSAVDVMPFLQYLKLSANLGYRSGFSENPFYLSPLLFLANLIPDFYGNTGVKNFSYLLVPNYGELALGYIGISGLLLSLFAFGKKAANQVWFFLAAAIICTALIYHAPIIYYLINRLPGFSLNYNNRLLYLWAFSGSVLAAFGLERFLHGEISKKQIRWTFSGFALFAIILIIANKIATKHWQFGHNLTWHTVNLWQDALILAFVINLTVAYFVLKNLPKKSAVTLLIILVSLETAIHGMIFLKTSRPQNFYPPTPAFLFLQKQFPVDNFRVFTYGDNLLPNIGSWYHINELNDHDTIYLESNKILKQFVANYNYSPEYTFDNPNLSALRFLSVKYLLYPYQQGSGFMAVHPQDLSVAYKDPNYEILALTNPFPRAYLINASGTADLQNKLALLIKSPGAVPISPVSNFQIAENGTENFNYSSSGGNYLIMADNYYPDWFAQINGQDMPVRDVMGLRVVQVPAGSHSVVVFYRSKSFEYGLIISLAAFLLWLGLLLGVRKYNSIPGASGKSLK